MAELPQGDKTPGVTTEGEGVPGGNGQGGGGDGNPPTPQSTEERGAGGGAEEKMGRLRTAAPPRPQRETAADNGSVGNPIRHTAVTEGARPENGALARPEYGLLTLTVSAVNPDDVGDLGSENGHEATRGTCDQARRETEEGDKTRQRALPARGMRGINDRERRPPERLRAINACRRQGRERGGGPST